MSSKSPNSGSLDDNWKSWTSSLSVNVKTKLAMFNSSFSFPWFNVPCFLVNF
jgi:hypothetical protein